MADSGGETAQENFESVIALLREENKKLLLEAKKLARDLKYERALNERNKVNAEAKARLSAAVSAERSRLEKYMDLLLANSQDHILIFDPEGRLVVASDSYLRARRIVAFSIISGKTCRELLEGVVSEDFLQYMDALFQNEADTKRPVEGECDIKSDSGELTRHYVVQATPMVEGSGVTEGAMLFFYDTTDITEARNAAENARDLAEQSTRSKSEFLARMSHEIRTPMNAVIGMTSIAKASNDPARKEYCLDKIIEASHHLLGVINDILDMSKIEANKFELSVSEFSFETMIQRVAGVINFRAEERRQRFTVNLDRDIPQNIISDEQRLAQVITNLLSNAVKFTPEEGSISLTAKKLSETNGVCALRVTVKDDGIGISEEQQSRLFRSFEQADGSISRKFGGTGLGLVISKRIVELMDGKIWIESKAGEGSSFIFEIKARVAAAAPVEEEAEYDYAKDEGAFAGHRILIAEDVEINREIIGALIEHTGIEIDFAENGKEAFKKFTDNPERYELIMMDVQMPEMDGYEATKRIRASGVECAKTIPIIAMTANVFREDIERCLASGMNGHLGKPVDAVDVIKKLRETLAIT